jgi:hypothetical protein
MMLVGALLFAAAVSSSESLALKRKQDEPEEPSTEVRSCAVLAVCARPLTVADA